MKIYFLSCNKDAHIIVEDDRFIPGRDVVVTLRTESGDEITSHE